VVRWRGADISERDDIARAIGELVTELGRLDVLVNNAAARAFGLVAHTRLESWALILQTNVTGLAMCSRAALPHLRKSGSGSVVNVSSVFAMVGRQNMGQYDASKAATLALTRVLACEEARYGIRVNAVCPSSTWTPWTYGRAEARGMSLEELKTKGAAPCLLGRWAEAEADRAAAMKAFAKSYSSVAISGAPDWIRTSICRFRRSVPLRFEPLELGRPELELNRRGRFCRALNGSNTDVVVRRDFADSHIVEPYAGNRSCAASLIRRSLSIFVLRGLV
jgi:NAD(P)-dependent dehydrogenase (short-subunit alcohol dehydrogenase family)